MTLPDEITINGVLYVRAVRPLNSQDHLWSKVDKEMFSQKTTEVFRETCLKNGISPEECSGFDKSYRFKDRRYAVMRELYNIGWGKWQIAAFTCRSRSLVYRVVTGRAK